MNRVGSARGLGRGDMDWHGLGRSRMDCDELGWKGMDWNGLGWDGIEKMEHWENRCWREERLNDVDGVGKDRCLRFRAFCCCHCFGGGGGRGCC